MSTTIVASTLRTAMLEKVKEAQAAGLTNGPIFNVLAEVMGGLVAETADEGFEPRMARDLASRILTHARR